MRVLVADDDTVYRNLLDDLLTKWDFQVLLAKDGQEALKLLDGDDPPMLVLLDWEMPKVDGFQVARAIRASQANRDAYVLMITGNRRKEDMLQVLVCGADDFLMKPFEVIDLKIHLRIAMRILHLERDLAEARKLAPTARS